MVNAILVAQGYAQMATFPLNVRYVDLFRQLQRGAGKDDRGLWSECQGLEPSEKQQQEYASSSVAITCIHDASGNDNINENGEWVVLEAKQDVNLDGWTLSDESNHKYKFPGNFSLKKGEMVRIYIGSKDKTEKDTGCGRDAVKELFWISERAVWNNASLKHGGETVVSCSYSGGGEARC